MISQNLEEKTLLSFISKPNSYILDIGCGVGRYLVPLTQENHTVIGIDKNPDIVTKLNIIGYKNVYTVEKAQNVLAQNFDYIIMSHIIEHIESKDLISFFDSYLKYLKRGGQLIIATPSLHKRFYDDYDHVKPYTPKSIYMLFSDYEQHQQKPITRLKLEKVWLRNAPINIISYPGMSYTKKMIINIVNKLLAIIYKFSFGIISENTGWIGVFTKV